MKKPVGWSFNGNFTLYCDNIDFVVVCISYFSVSVVLSLDHIFRERWVQMILDQHLMVFDKIIQNKFVQDHLDSSFSKYTVQR